MNYLATFFTHSGAIKFKRNLIKKNIENEEIKLLFGDMEMYFDRLNNYLNWGFASNDFYKCYGEVNAFLYCLHSLGMFTEEQVQTMISVLKELEREQVRKGEGQVKKCEYKYCPHCGAALN